MAKSSQRVILVRKWVTTLLLALYTLAITGLIYFLSGKAYVRERSPLLLFGSLIQRFDRGALTNSALVATLMPSLVTLLLFAPWGFLLFLTLDRPGHSRFRLHLGTCLAGLLFGLAIAAWQSVLPTQVTTWYDALWSALGTLAGSLAGYLRKRVRIQFR